jgi:predicted amidohydrolase
MSVRVASCAYPIERHATFASFAAKQAALVAQAAEQGAALLVFPEYGTMELGSLLPPDERATLASELHALQRFLAPTSQLYGALAVEHRVYILAPSFPEQRAERRYVNSARLHGPSGSEGVAEKLLMTRFENEQWFVSPGECSGVFETELGVLGVAICYDSEFPLIVRRQVEAGAAIVLVPSCTDTLAGYQRVALSCRARALENQCFVVQAPTVGDAPWSQTVDVNRGAAAVYGPVDRGFPDDGVIAAGPLDTPGWVFADLDLEALAQVREQGQVRNHRDFGSAAHVSGQVIRTRV